MHNNAQQQIAQKAEALYEKYGKPLEGEFAGKYLAVSKTGKIILGESVSALVRKAKTELGPVNFIYKIGERSVGKWL